MTGEARGSMLPVSVATALVSAVLCASPGMAQMSERCAGIVTQASVRAVGRTPVIGQTIALGRPFAIEPGVLRAEVEVFGPQTQLYEVDVTIDSACRVLAATTRLESQSEFLR
jgi:hypothetical protein